MNRELFDVVAGILTDQFDVDAERVRPDATLVSLVKEVRRALDDRDG